MSSFKRHVRRRIARAKGMPWRRKRAVTVEIVEGYPDVTVTTPFAQQLRGAS